MQRVHGGALGWTGQVTTIAPDGPAVTEFHVTKPSGWPPGSYKLEIMLDGKTAATKSFSVRA